MKTGHSDNGGKLKCRHFYPHCVHEVVDSKPAVCTAVTCCHSHLFTHVIIQYSIDNGAGVLMFKKRLMDPKYQQWILRTGIHCLTILKSSN